MYTDINHIPRPKKYTLEMNAMLYYSILYTVKEHKYQYDVNIPIDVPYDEFCKRFYDLLDDTMISWLQDIEYADFDHCEDPDSIDIIWAIEVVLNELKKKHLDYKLKDRWCDEDLPF